MVQGAGQSRRLKSEVDGSGDENDSMDMWIYEIGHN